MQTRAASTHPIGWRTGLSNRVRLVGTWCDCCSTRFWFSACGRKWRRNADKGSSMTWSYSERVSPKRQAMLYAATSFQSIIDRVLDEMRITSSDFPPGEIGAVKGCTRPEFSLVVCPDTFDLFFNSPQGYRGQYHKSAKAGQTPSSACG